MNKQVLIESLNQIGEKYIIFDDALYNPIEVILLTHNKKKLLHWLKTQGIKSITEEEKERKLTILSYGELGVKQLSTIWETRADKLTDHIYCFSKEDKKAFLMLYVYTYTERNSWMRQNIIKNLKMESDIFDEDNLAQCLASYLSNEMVKISAKHLVALPDCIWNQMSSFHKMEHVYYKYVKKIARRLILQVLIIKGYVHRKKSRKGFLKYIKKQGRLCGTLTDMPECKGGTDCHFIKEEYQDEVYFIKGDELSIYNGLPNEIRAQITIREKTANKDWYLPMVEADPDKKWIKYPFVSWQTLDEYVANGNRLDEQQCKLLGECLLTILKEMERCGVKHNDLRPNNIMVKSSEQNDIEGFILTDFGCSCLEEGYPWRKTSTWGKYFAKDLCGIYRYNEHIVDDAASAYLVYVYAGGRADDDVAYKLNEMVGKHYLVSDA